MSNIIITVGSIIFLGMVMDLLFIIAEKSLIKIGKNIFAENVMFASWIVLFGYSVYNALYLIQTIKKELNADGWLTGKLAAFVAWYLIFGIVLIIYNLILHLWEKVEMYRRQ